jgi:Ca-activated chloride channel family protein
MKTEIETDEARILASLLGENDTVDEHAAVARLLASNPALRAWHDEVRALLPCLNQAIRDTVQGNGATPALRMDPAQRIALVEKLRRGTSPPPAANVISWQNFARQNLGFLATCTVFALACVLMSVAGVGDTFFTDKFSSNRVTTHSFEVAQREGIGGGNMTDQDYGFSVMGSTESHEDMVGGGGITVGTTNPISPFGTFGAPSAPAPAPSAPPQLNEHRVQLGNASAMPVPASASVHPRRIVPSKAMRGTGNTLKMSKEADSGPVHGDVAFKSKGHAISPRALAVTGGGTLPLSGGLVNGAEEELDEPIIGQAYRTGSGLGGGFAGSVGIGMGSSSGSRHTTPARVDNAKSSERPVIAETDATANLFSTFSLNVSDASFQLAAASIQRGERPAAGTLRTEEFINALAYADPPPAPNQPLNLTQEQARDPNAHNRNYLRLSLQTAATGRDARQPLNLTILLDTSGSMERADRQATVAAALRTLAELLQPHDRVSLIGFARTPRIVFDNLDGATAAVRLQGLPGTLPPDGGTNIELALGEALRKNNATRGAHTHNRVALLTDGAANLGDADPERLASLIEEAKRRDGITLDAYGIGYDDYNDTLLETLARKANGRYAYLNTPEEAREDFAHKLAGALQVAAQNVKVQVEFNAARVGAYRLHGYDNHRLGREDFRDNSVRAAQLTAAENGTALYSVQPKPDGTGPLGVLHVRYQDPQTFRYHEREWTIPYDPAPPALENAPAGIRLAASAALLAEKLAGNSHTADVPFQFLLKLVREANATQKLAAGTNTAARQLQSMLETLQREEPGK